MYHKTDVVICQKKDRKEWREEGRKGRREGSDLSIPSLEAFCQGLDDSDGMDVFRKREVGKGWLD